MSIFDKQNHIDRLWQALGHAYAKRNLPEVLFFASRLVDNSLARSEPVIEFDEVEPPATKL